MSERHSDASERGLVTHLFLNPLRLSSLEMKVEDLKFSSSIATERLLQCLMQPLPHGKPPTSQFCEVNQGNPTHLTVMFHFKEGSDNSDTHGCLDLSMQLVDASSASNVANLTGIFNSHSVGGGDVGFDTIPYEPFDLTTPTMRTTTTATETETGSETRSSRASAKHARTGIRIRIAKQPRLFSRQESRNQRGQMQRENAKSQEFCRSLPG